MIYDPRFIKLAPIECGDTYTIYRVVYAPERKSPTLLGEGSIPGYQGMILTDDSIRSIANRYPRNDEEYAFVSLFKESHLGDKNLSLGAAPDDYDGRYRKVAAIAWLLAREGSAALRSFES